MLGLLRVETNSIEETRTRKRCNYCKLNQWRLRQYGEANIIDHIEDRTLPEHEGELEDEDGCEIDSDDSDDDDNEAGSTLFTPQMKMKIVQRRTLRMLTNAGV